MDTPKYIILLLLAGSVIVTSTNGQSTANTAIKSTGDRQSFTSKYPRLTKTQGTTEHQNVHCSLQDRNGNLWFGTTGEGVYRYDGKEFTQYTEKDGLSNNTVWSILEDTSGNIWFGTDNGLSRYDGKAILKIPVMITKPDIFGTVLSPVADMRVWSLFQDRNGITWLGTSADLYCYDGKSFSRFLDRRDIVNLQHLKLTCIQCFSENSDGTLWMGSGPIAMEGVIRFDGKSITGSRPNGDGWIRYMVKDKKERIWFGGRSKGNFIFDGKRFTNFTERTGIGNPVLADHSGKIWFNGEEKTGTVKSEGGIWSYDGSIFRNYNGMGSYSVFSMLTDKTGNIWIGARNCGLYRFDGQSFTSFSE